MSTPAPQNDDREAVRRRLLEAAAQLVDEHGPEALTARRLATAAGTSTMAVYTHFGGMPAVAREMVAEGFRRLAEHTQAQPHTKDAAADLVELAVAYRANAVENPHLYSVMFGATSLGGYSLAPEELEVGIYTFLVLVGAVERAMDQGVLRRADPSRVAEQLWSSMHGYVMLELAGMHLTTEDPVNDVLRPLMTTLVAGLGVGVPGAATPER